MGRRGRSTLLLLGAALSGVLYVSAPAGAVTSDRAPALIHAGIAAYSAGAPDRALQAFAEAASKAPHDALPALWAGSAAAAAGRWEEARAYFREALRRPHSTMEGHLAEAWLVRLDALSARLPGSVDPRSRIAELAYGSNPRLTWSQARWLGLAVEAAAGRAGIDPWLLAAVIYTESRFNHQSISRAGALGLGQLMPGTARAAGVNPVDPWENVVGSAAILRWNYLEFRSWPLALAGYNAGSEAVRRYGGIPPYPETQWYVRAVLWLHGQLKRSA